MFHSGGTVQSSTGVPDGTSVSWIGMCRAMIRSVSRSPSPVMLRQIGYSSSMSAVIAASVDAHRSGVRIGAGPRSG